MDPDLGPKSYTSCQIGHKFGPKKWHKLPNWAQIWTQIVTQAPESGSTLGRKSDTSSLNDPRFGPKKWHKLPNSAQIWTQISDMTPQTGPFWVQRETQAPDLDRDLVPQCDTSSRNGRVSKFGPKRWHKLPKWVKSLPKKWHKLTFGPRFGLKKVTQAPEMGPDLDQESEPSSRIGPHYKPKKWHKIPKYAKI